MNCWRCCNEACGKRFITFDEEANFCPYCTSVDISLFGLGMWECTTCADRAKRCPSMSEEIVGLEKRLTDMTEIKNKALGKVRELKIRYADAEEEATENMKGWHAEIESHRRDVEFMTAHAEKARRSLNVSLDQLCNVAEWCESHGEDMLVVSATEYPKVCEAILQREVKIQVENAEAECKTCIRNIRGRENEDGSVLCEGGDGCC